MVDVHGKITFKPMILPLQWRCLKSFKLGLEEAQERECSRAIVLQMRFVNEQKLSPHRWFSQQLPPQRVLYLDQKNHVKVSVAVIVMLVDEVLLANRNCHLLCFLHYWFKIVQLNSMRVYKNHNLMMTVLLMIYCTYSCIT